MNTEVPTYRLVSEGDRQWGIFTEERRRGTVHRDETGVFYADVNPARRFEDIDHLATALFNDRL